MIERLKQFYRKKWIYRCRICGKEIEALHSIEMHLKDNHPERIKRKW